MSESLAALIVYYSNFRPWDPKIILLFDLSCFDKLPTILVLGLSRCVSTTNAAFHHNPG